MTKRENITIKTKYETKQDCIENCRDIKRKTRLATTYSRQISGEVYTDGSFELSSRAKGSAMYEFRGIIKEEADGIYMVMVNNCPIEWIEGTYDGLQRLIRNFNYKNRYNWRY